MIVINKIIDIALHCLRVENYWFFFTSFQGQYNDNPKYISEKVHEEIPKAKIFWEISSKSKQNDIPDYVNKIRAGKFRYYYVKNKCRVAVDNFAGLYMSSATGIKGKVVSLLKNKKQFNLSTSHGTPVKTLWVQDPDSSITKEGFKTTSDVLVAGSELSKHLYEMATGDKVPVVAIGTPRTDILFNKDEGFLASLREKLGLPFDKKILLFAPTWRTSPEDSGVKQIEQIDFDALFETLNKKFGGEWVFVFRLHNLALKAADINKLKEKYGSDRFYNGNNFDDMMEYMAVCDIMISDYSGAIYDWTLVNKPGFLYAHDRDEYENHGRGLYHTMDFFPYSFSDSFDELIDNINRFDQISFEQERIAFLEKIGNVEDGKASARAVEILKKQIIAE